MQQQAQTNNTHNAENALHSAQTKMDILEGLTSSVSAPVLPVKNADAVLSMIRITQKLIDVSERETQALLQNDAFALNVTQDEKESVADRYMKAAMEFRHRLEDFRNTDQNTLRRLEDLQNKLSERMSDNRNLIERMYTKARTTTQETLVNVQEMAQDKRLKFEGEKDQEVNG